MKKFFKALARLCVHTLHVNPCSCHSEPDSESLGEKIKRGLKAFSLIELMISLIIVSCIVSSFAPVISKKMKVNKMAIGGSGGGISSFSFKCNGVGSLDSNCSLCDKNKQTCVLCQTECADGKFVNASTCKCDNCTTLFPNCTKCNETKCITPAAGYYIDTAGKAQKCPKGFYCSDGSKFQCPPGKYGTVEGKSTITEACSDCTIGNYCTGGTHIQTCPAGTYTDAVGQSTCQCSDCSSLFTGCTKCDETKCKVASAGYYIDGTGKPVKCPN